MKSKEGTGGNALVTPDPLGKREAWLSSLGFRKGEWRKMPRGKYALEIVKAWVTGGRQDHI